MARLIARLVPRRIMRNRRFFPLWQEHGYHVTPVHHYQPIPDTRTLRDDLWCRPSQLVGIDMNEARQLELLATFSSKFKAEYDAFPTTPTPVPHQYYLAQDMFRSVDAEILYCMIRHFRPRRIIEIGSGFSTYLAAQALCRNQQEDQARCELIAVEPHPNEVLKAGFPSLTELRTTRVQDVPLSEFESLAENDILFIDSSHVATIGSDVQYEYLEIIPRLHKGVLIHAHDIWLPAEYPKDWVLDKCRFWNEQYLLAAFLAFNDSFEVLWASCHMHLCHPEKLKAAFRSYQGNAEVPVSFWLRRTK